MPQTIDNGEVRAQLQGVGTYDGKVHYLSAIGTSQEIKSLKATVTMGKTFYTQSNNRVKHDKGNAWMDFKTAIPGSSYHHWIWVSLEPTIITLIDQRIALACLYQSEFEENEQFQAVFRERAELANELRKSDLPTRLAWNINKHLDVPVVPEWAEELTRRALRTNDLRTGRATGDCLEIYKRSDDPKPWKDNVLFMLNSGLVH